MTAETVQPTTETTETAEHAGVLGSLGINGTLFAAQLVNFLILVLVMWKFVYTPLLKMMDKRQKEISDGLKNAKTAEIRLTEAEDEKKRLVNEANAEAHALLEEARTKVESLRAEKMTQVKTEIEGIAAEAKQRLQAEREAAYDALRRDIAELVAQATRKVAAGMDEKAHRAEIERALKELEHAKV